MSAELKYLKPLKALKASQKRKIDELITPRLTKYIKCVPTVKQTVFLLLDDREVFFGGAAGPGKTVALLMAALQYVDIPGYHAILFRDTYTNLTEPGALMFLAQEWLRNTDAHWNGSDKMWRFPSGATLSFGHLTNPNDHFDYQSAQFQFIGIDEAVAIRENQALYMFSRLRDIKDSVVPLRFRVASNPPNHQQLARGEWVKRRYVNDKTREPGAIFLPAKMDDNPHLNKDEYLKSLARMNDSVTAKQLEDGDWNIQARGRMIDRTWFKFTNNPPPVIGHAIRYWDMAATEKTDKNEPCFTAGVKMYKSLVGYIIEDVRRVQKGPGKLESEIKLTAIMDTIKTHIFMEQEPGSAGIIAGAYFRKLLEGYTFDLDRVSVDKVDRAYPFASQAEAGQIWLVEGPWNKPFLDELELFPDGRFKDQVDATSGAFNKLALGGARVSVGAA